MAAQTGGTRSGARRVLDEADALLDEARSHDEGSHGEVAGIVQTSVAYERSAWELRAAKQRFMAFYTNHHMARFLAGDEEGRQTDAARIESELAEKQRDVKRLKGECSCVEDKTKAAIEDLCKGLEQLETSRETLRALIANRRDDVNQHKSGKENKQEMQTRVEKLRVVEESLQLQREAIARYRTLLAGTDSELAQAKETAERQGRQLAEREWEMRASQLLQGLCGVRLLPGATRESLSVEMVLSHDAPLRLDLSLRPNDTVSSVQASGVMLGVEDLCDGTVCSVLAEIRCRYEEQAATTAEIQHLQSCFAVDWQLSQRKMRVLLGATASVVCTLQVPPGYPASGGGANLLTVTGVEPVPDVATLRPPQDVPTLTNWITYLQQVFV